MKRCSMAFDLSLLATACDGGRGQGGGIRVPGASGAGVDGGDHAGGPGRMARFEERSAGPSSAMRSHARLWAVAATLLCACEPPAEVSAPILDGVRERGEPAVVSVDRPSDWSQGCTGTLISPSVVLTAKHCVQEPGADAPYAPEELLVGVGDRLGPTLRTHRVRRVETTPGAYFVSPFRGAIYGIDVATLVLEAPITDVVPIPIRRDRPDDVVGGTFTAVGFGVRSDGGTAEKYVVSGTLTSIRDDGVMYTTAVACPGDSGGPMIQEGSERRVIGVASSAELTASNRCPAPDTENGYNGLWDLLPLIDRARAVAGECLDAGDERCNSADDDCDGAVDEGCTPLGGACTTSEECAFAQDPELDLPIEDAARCEEIGGESICTRPCDPTRPRTSCASIPLVAGGATEIGGLYCAHTSGCEGRCLAGAAGELADGEPCEADVECESLACRDPGDGARRCLPPCRGGDGACPAGDACAAAVGACGSCVDPGIVGARRQLGEPCAADAQCAEGSTCVEDPAGGYCTHACDGDPECAAGYRCEGARCLRGARASIGEPCATQGECAAPGFCVQQNGRGWCSQLCENECPGDLECVAASDAHVCAPAGALLGEACTADPDCGAGDACESGVCTRACGPEAACPVGFACARDADGRARCRAPAAPGGCSITGGSRGSLAWLALALAAAVARRRRRRHRRAG